ncbi:MAG: lipase maturation factor family protein [Acidobacteria bacterium]|nr:MAG: lipase maturation factor family protein [Acidobacteriota bacterium]
MRITASWLLRWLGFIYFWVFLGWWRQAPGLIGPQGILPAADYLHAVAAHFHPAARIWFTPSLLWISSSTAALHVMCGLGLAAAVAVMARWHSRWGLAVCLVCFLSLIACAQVFANYQSDGMLMTAGFFALFVDLKSPSWWSWFSLRWLWFTIYFGSGIAKWMSHDPQWRHLTALDQYYQNLPLPNWLGWYAQNYLPHSVEAAIAAAILILELFVVWLAFLPRRWRIALFWIVTPFQIAIILTANYGFLSWLVLGLGLTLIDDRHLHWLLRRPYVAVESVLASWRVGLASAVLVALVAVTGLNLAGRMWPALPTPQRVTFALQPFRIADPFGLFAVMTRNRYEIEFQGTRDGRTWTAYPFRYKPQDPQRAPAGDLFLFAPYQPRFDWNLWFASLSSVQQERWVESTELRLLTNDPPVLALFARNPFAARPPIAVRAVLWQYWFSTPAQKRRQGIWWRRKLLGQYAPTLVMTSAGVESLPTR